MKDLLTAESESDRSASLRSISVVVILDVELCCCEIANTNVKQSRWTII